MKLKKTMTWTLLIMASIPVLWTLIIVEDWQRDFSENFAKTDAAAADQRLHPVRSTLAAPALNEKLVAWVAGQSRWSLASSENLPDGTIKIHLVRTTMILRFKDDIHVTIRPQVEGGSLLEAESQSRLGKGDLGQNPRNLRELTDGLRK